MYYVDGFQQKFDGRRSCEKEDVVSYHKGPIDSRTWFTHYDSPYENPSSVTGLGAGSFFDQVNSILIPEKDGQSTQDQTKTVNGDLSKLNSAYKDVDSMTAARTKLGEDYVKYHVLPITWIRVTHPKGSGYALMSDAVIDNVLQYGAQGGDGGGTTQKPTPPTGRQCAGMGVNKDLGRDDMNNQISIFCADAVKQGVQDTNSGSIARTYNSGSLYEVDISTAWPPGLDIKGNIENNCKQYMTSIMDGNSSADPDLSALAY